MVSKSTVSISILSGLYILKIFFNGIDIKPFDSLKVAHTHSILFCNIQSMAIDEAIALALVGQFAPKKIIDLSMY